MSMLIIPSVMLAFSLAVFVAWLRDTPADYQRAFRRMRKPVYLD